MNSLYYCYLLQSTSSPKCFYIGFTNNPSNRIRQHNGEITNGARKTSKRRPWKFVAIISGFPNNIVALMFEWQFQHPSVSRLTKEFKDKIYIKSLQGCLSCLSNLISIPIWSQLHLHINIFESELYNQFIAISNKSNNMIINQYTYMMSLEEFNTLHKQNIKSINPTYQTCSSSSTSTSTTTPTVLSCQLCSVSYSETPTLLQWSCIQCNCSTHITCLAKSTRPSAPSSSSSTTKTINTTITSNTTPSLVPFEANCPTCRITYPWIEVHKRCISLQQSTLSSTHPSSSTNTTDAAVRGNAGDTGIGHNSDDLCDYNTDEVSIISIISGGDSSSDNDDESE